MAAQEINPEGVPLMLDSESLAIMRQLYPGKMDTKDYESFLREKANQALYKYQKRKRISFGQSPYIDQMTLNPQIVEMLAEYDPEYRAGSGPMPPNIAYGKGVEGGFPIGLIAGMVPGIIGSLISGVPQFVKLIRGARKSPTEGDGYTGLGAIAPPNLRRGGLAADFLGALIPAAQRVEARAAQAKSPAEFFHNLARGLKGEIPALLGRYTRVAPQHVNFLTEKLIGKMGIPKSFADFAKEEVSRIGSKVGEEAAPRLEKFVASKLGSGDGGSIKSLAKPVVKWILSKAMHKIGPVQSLYKGAKDLMGSIQDVYEYTGKGGASEGDVDGGRRRRPEKKKGVLSTVGSLARKVVGETLQKAAPTGSALLGKAADLVAERFLGGPTSIGSDIAQSLGEAVMKSTGEMLSAPPSARRARPVRDEPDYDLPEEEYDPDEPEEERYAEAVEEEEREDLPLRRRKTRARPPPPPPPSPARKRYPPPGRRPVRREPEYYEEEFEERPRRRVGRPRKAPVSEPAPPPPRVGAFPMGAGAPKKKAITIRVL